MTGDLTGDLAAGDDDGRPGGHRPGAGAGRLARPTRLTRRSSFLRAPGVLAAAAKRAGFTAPIIETDPAGARAAFSKGLPVVPLKNAVEDAPGRPSAANAAATIELIERAVEAIRQGHVRAVVTNPIAKATLYQAGFEYPGHTEYLGALAEAWGAPAFPVMMIWSETLAVVPVTIHIPLADAPKALTADLIIRTGRIVDRDLRARFHLTRPRLAVAGLNPHAGEGGAMGREEITIIGPAIEALRAEGIDVVGPLPADTMFHHKSAGALRCGAHDVSRPGPDPGEDPRLRRRRQCHARSAVRAHLPRSRHGVRHRRKGCRQPCEPHRGAQARRPTDAMSLAADGLPPLSDVVAAHGLNARKALGQNFLFDLNLTRKIARSAGPLAGVAVIEVGPGPGGLTRALLSEGAEKVIAIERDARALGALAEIAAHWPGRLEIIEGDALRVSPETLIAKAGSMPIRIVANLPYNIATALLAGWLEAEPWPPFYDRLTLMFQREVAERIVATPAQRADYGRLAVLAGWRTEARIQFDIPPAAFVPAPKVTSSVVELVPRSSPEPCDAATLSALAQAAFGQRRKMLRQSLKAFAAARGLDLPVLIATAGLEPTMRAEEVDVAGFVALARAVVGSLGRNDVTK